MRSHTPERNSLAPDPKIARLIWNASMGSNSAALGVCRSAVSLVEHQRPQDMVERLSYFTATAAFVWFILLKWLYWSPKRAKPHVSDCVRRHWRDHALSRRDRRNSCVFLFVVLNNIHIYQPRTIPFITLVHRPLALAVVLCSWPLNLPHFPRKQPRLGPENAKLPTPIQPCSYLITSSHRPIGRGNDNPNAVRPSL